MMSRYPNRTSGDLHGILGTAASKALSVIWEKYKFPIIGVGSLIVVWTTLDIIGRRIQESEQESKQ